MKAPEKIYLQVCGDCKDNDCKNCKFEDLEDNVTWCKDKIFDKDIEYTRTDTLEEENHRKFYETLCWRKCSDDMLNQKLNIRTTESGNKFLIVDGYEISIDTLLKLQKEN